MSEEKFVVKEGGGTWGVYTNLSSHYHCLASGLTEGQAKTLKARLDAVLRMPLIDTARFDNLRQRSEDQARRLREIDAEAKARRDEVMAECPVSHTFIESGRGIAEPGFRVDAYYDARTRTADLLITHKGEAVAERTVAVDRPVDVLAGEFLWEWRRANTPS